MIALPALVVLLLLIAFILNGDRYGVVATVIGSSAATILLCAMFFDWARRHPGGTFDGFLTAFRLVPASGPSPVYLLGWLLVIIAYVAVLLVPVRIVRLPKAGLGYVTAWIAGMGVLLSLVDHTAPAIRFFLKFYSGRRVAPLVPTDDASFQALVHIVLPVAWDPVTQALLTNHLTWIGIFLYLVPFAIWWFRLYVPGLGETKPRRFIQNVPPVLLFLFGIFLLKPWH